MRSSAVFSLLFACAAVTAAADEIEREEGVAVLTNKNFHKAIKDNDFVLVKFYAPWCGHCKALAPAYEKAAQQLAEEDSSIMVSKLDATVHTEVAQEHGIQGYPTLKFFVKGKPMDYTGDRKAESIVNWLKKKSGPPSIFITHGDHLKQLKEKHPVLVVALTKDKASAFATAFANVASVPEDESVVYATIDLSADGMADVAKEAGVDHESDSLVLFKHFDEGRVVFDKAQKLEDEAEIKLFIASHSLPLVVEFSQETAQRIFGGNIKNHLILFVSYGDEEKYAAIKEEASGVAADFKGKVIFVTINIDDTEHERISEFFGMTKDSPVGMRLIHLEEEMAKYKPESDSIDAASMRSFVTQFLDGKLKQHYLSEAVPEGWDAEPVKVLVGENFVEVANQPGKTVIVMFYAPWCGHCKALTPIWEELAKKFGDRDDIMVGKIDSTANELEGIKIQGFPTIKLFSKSNQVIEYNGERTLDALAKFVESDGAEGGGDTQDEEILDEDEISGEEDDDASEEAATKDEL